MSGGLPGLESDRPQQVGLVYPRPSAHPLAPPFVLYEIAEKSTALGLILVAWLLCVGSCTGIGLLWQRAWGPHARGAGRLFAAFWSGLALTIGALQLWHFLWPVGPAACVLLLLVGASGLVVERASLAPFRPASVSQWGVVGAACIGGLWLALRCLRPLEHYDTGLYLLGAMTWFGDEALVPGLANLHGRFGFNNAHLLFAALFDVGPWTDRAPNLVNGCLILVFLAGCLHGGRALWGATASARAGAAFAWLMIPPVLMLLAGYLVSLSTDLPATLIALWVAWRSFRLLAGEVEGAEARRGELRDLTLLAAAGVCVKLSALVFLGGVWLTAVVAVRPDLRHRDWLAAAAIGGALLCPWLIRGAVLSGYPLFPSSLISIPVEWRVPILSVENEAAWVKAWARVPGVPRELALNGWYWLESWMSRHLVLRVGVGMSLPVLLGGLGVFGVLVASSLGRHSGASRGLWLLVPSAAAFGFWFWTAPDPRFAMFVFWSLAATGVAAAIGVWGANPIARYSVIALVTALSLASAPRDPIRAGTERGFHPLPVVETARFETASGLTVNVPVGTDKCWRTLAPCTPYRYGNLRLRESLDFGRGFARGS